MGPIEVKKEKDEDDGDRDEITAEDCSDNEEPSSFENLQLPGTSKQKLAVTLTLDNWNVASREKNKGFLNRFKSFFHGNKKYQKNDGTLKQRKQTAKAYAEKVRLARFWVQWTLAVERGKNSGILVERAIKHFRYGMMTRAFYTYVIYIYIYMFYYIYSSKNNAIRLAPPLVFS